MEGGWGENGAEPVEDWGLVGKDRNQVSGGKGGRGAGGTKAQGGKEGRSERSCKEGLRNTEEEGKESAHPCLCLKAKPPLPPDQKPFLTGLPSNSPAQLRSDEEGGNLSSSSLDPDQKRPNILAHK